MPNGDPGHAVPHRKRCKRYNTPGHSHYLTFSCFQRKPFLNGTRSRQWLIEAIALARASHQFHLWAYVIMPEHAHLLIFPTREAYDISRIFTTIKQSVSKRAIAYVRNNAPDFLGQMSDRRPDGEVITRFWQRGGGYDRNLWTARDVWEKIDYIHDNPVKRNLSVSPAGWHWSSAGDFAGVTQGPLSIDFDTIPKRT